DFQLLRVPKLLPHPHEKARAGEPQFVLVVGRYQAHQRAGVALLGSALPSLDLGEDLGGSRPPPPLSDNPHPLHPAHHDHHAPPPAGRRRPVGLRRTSTVPPVPPYPPDSFERARATRSARSRPLSASRASPDLPAATRPPKNVITELSRRASTV